MPESSQSWLEPENSKANRIGWSLRMLGSSPALLYCSNNFGMALDMNLDRVGLAHFQLEQKLNFANFSRSGWRSLTPKQRGCGSSFQKISFSGITIFQNYLLFYLAPIYLYFSFILKNFWTFLSPYKYSFVINYKEDKQRKKQPHSLIQHTYK